MSFTVERIEKQVECPEHGLVGMVFIRHQRPDGFAFTMEVCGACLVDGVMVLEPPLPGLSDETLVAMKKALSTGYSADLDGKVIDIDASHLSDKIRLGVRQRFLLTNTGSGKEAYDAVEAALKAASQMNTEQPPNSQVLGELFDQLGKAHEAMEEGSDWRTNDQEIFDGRDTQPT